MKKNIAIVYGGNSSEFEISVQSGENIYNYINKNIYNAYLVQLKGTEWKVTGEPYNGTIVNKDDFSFIFEYKKIKFDCALIAIHGTPGEDGRLQAYLELVNVPYTTCGVLSSALTFDKFTCNSYLRNFGVVLANSILIRKNEEINLNKIVERVGLPCFVKPNNGGSSCGTSKVKHIDELESAIKKSFHEDNGVIIEQFIEGTEVTCGLFKNKNREIIFPLTEIVSKKEFFDYEAKYTPGLSDEIVPARISNEKAAKCKQIASRIYDLLDCRGIVRMDFIIKDDDFYFLEVNTVPGMTLNSIVPKMIRANQMSITDILTMLIEMNE